MPRGSTTRPKVHAVRRRVSEGDIGRLAHFECSPRLELVRRTDTSAGFGYVRQERKPCSCLTIFPDVLIQESTVLRDSIAEIADTAPAGSLLAFTWSGLLRSLDVRLENLQLSKKLLVRTRENFTKACHLESLEIEGFS